MTVPEVALVDSHVHFWDPRRFEYRWLTDHPTIHRAFLPEHYFGDGRTGPVERLVFVEANPRRDQAGAEVVFIEELARFEPRIGGIVAFVDLRDPDDAAAAFDSLAGRPLVRGIRHNIQGHPAGFATRSEFVAGVQEAGRRGLTFDICATHDQLAEVIALARNASGSRLVLDHCAKPAIRAGLTEPWARQIEELAALPNVWCKISGLLTEADLQNWRPEQIRPYFDHIVSCFGTERVMYGSDWPVLTLAERGLDWYALMVEWTSGWTATEKARFFGGNAREFYQLA